MPAVTLGFEEIEDRLQTVRRRVNLFAVQHIGYVAVSVLAIAGAALIVAALRGSPQMFSVTLFVALAAGFGTLLIAPFLVMRRWRDLQMIAALVDRRADLQDRLVTLLSARDRQPPARLAGFLMAETLALGRRWEPRVVVPRRVPRSLYLFLAALIALGSTAFVSRQPRPPASAVSVAGGGAAASPAQPLAGAQLAGHPSGLNQARLDAGGSPPDGAAQSVSSATRNPAGDQAEARAEGANLPDIDEPSPHSNRDAFGHQLQQLIQDAFTAQAAGQPQQLARRNDPRGTADRDRAGQAERSGQPDGRDRDRTGSGPGRNDSGAAGGHHANAGANASDRDGHAPQPNAPGDRPPNSEQSGNSGKGSGAGSGSASGGLLAAKGGHGVGAAGELKTFKVTLVSFLQSASLKPAPEPKSPRGRVGDDGFASAAHGASEPGEVQLSDDLIRKPEIPPEYEEIVRRVYSQRPAP